MKDASQKSQINTNAYIISIDFTNILRTRAEQRAVFSHKADTIIVH